MPVIDHERFLARRLTLQGAPTDNITRVIIICTLICGLALWVGFLWAVVHFLG